MRFTKEEPAMKEEGLKVMEERFGKENVVVK